VTAVPSRSGIEHQVGPVAGGRIDVPPEAEPSRTRRWSYPGGEGARREGVGIRVYHRPRRRLHGEQEEGRDWV
jgi:hypothetical protein